MTDTKLHIWGYAEGCPACTKIKALCDLLGVTYEFHDIARDGRERAALRDAGFDTVPQVFTPDGGHVGDWQGFRKAAITAIDTLSLPLTGAY